MDGRENLDTGNGPEPNVEASDKPAQNSIPEIDPGTIVKRKRGRPRKYPEGETRQRDYAAENAKRRAGKQTDSKGAKNAVPVKGEPVNVAGLEAILYSLHAFAASVIPEMEMDKAEAHQLADAIAAVNAHYDTRMDPKILAWVNLTTVCAGLYAPRFVAFGLRRKLQQTKPEPLHVVSKVAQNAQPETTGPENKPPMSATLKTVYSDPNLVPDVGADNG